MEKPTVDISWMRFGVRVEYAPPFLQGTRNDRVYSGRLGGEPFLVGCPKNNRWVVRIENMDERYQKMFGRSVHSNAGVEYVTRVTSEEGK